MCGTAWGRSHWASRRSYVSRTMTPSVLPDDPCCSIHIVRSATSRSLIQSRAAPWASCAARF
eukprot:1634758-Heterocapsa_arctica.AAC.1